jgi:hypothetical protein
LQCLTIICNTSTILYSKQLAKSNKVTALNINLLWNHTIYKNRFHSHYNRTWPILDAKLPWLLDNLLWHPEFHTRLITKQLNSLPLTKSPPWKSISCNVKMHGHRKQQDLRGFAVPGIFHVNFFVFQRWIWSFNVTFFISVHSRDFSALSFDFTCFLRCSL